MQARVVFLSLLVATAVGAPTVVNELYWGNSCTGTPYDYSMGTCQQFNTVSFIVVPRERQACIQETSMFLRYYGSSTNCSGESTTAIVQNGQCTALGDISIRAEITGLLLDVKCVIIESMAKLSEATLSFGGYSPSATCNGTCISCADFPMAGGSASLKECEGCCPNDEGTGYKKSYTSCVHMNDTNIVVLADQTFTDAACTAGAGEEELHFTNGQCTATNYGSRKYTLSDAQPICNVVYLMGEYGFSMGGSLLSQTEFAQKVPYAAAAVEASGSITIDFDEAAPTAAVPTALLAVALAVALF